MPLNSAEQTPAVLQVERRLLDSPPGAAPARWGASGLAAGRTLDQTWVRAMFQNLHSTLSLSSLFTLLPQLMPQVSGAPTLCQPCGPPAQGQFPLDWGGRVLAGGGASCMPRFPGLSRLCRVLPAWMVLLTVRFL